MFKCYTPNSTGSGQIIYAAFDLCTKRFRDKMDIYKFLPLVKPSILLYITTTGQTENNRSLFGNVGKLTKADGVWDGNDIRTAEKKNSIRETNIIYIIIYYYVHRSNTHRFMFDERYRKVSFSTQRVYWISFFFDYLKQQK